MPGIEVDGNDVLAVREAMTAAVARARSGEGPSLVVLETYRMLGHSSSDDPSKYREDANVALVHLLAPFAWPQSCAEWSIRPEVVGDAANRPAGRTSQEVGGPAKDEMSEELDKGKRPLSE